MYYMIMLIISNLEHSFTVLDAWEENGVPGVTIMEGTGLGGLGRPGSGKICHLCPVYWILCAAANNKTASSSRS